MRCRRGRSDEIGHRFGLRQVHFAIQERTARELTGLCRHGAGCHQQLDDTMQHKGRTVARNLRGIFASVGVRRAKNGNEYFVDERSVLRVDDLSESQRMRATIGQ